MDAAMAVTTMEVLKPGMFSTFQDLGRHGWQHLGVPVSGAMDEASHRIANLLVGNDESEATLEITLLGPTLRFDRDVLIALAGAELSAVVVGPEPPAFAAPLALHEPAILAAGSTLQFGPRVAGLRCYLALAGGFGLPQVLGSRSTYVRGAMGGHEGRALRKGDRLPLPGLERPDVLQPLDAASNNALKALLADLDPGPMRAMKGREWGQFKLASQAAFFTEAAVVGAQSERMGYRLQRPHLERIVSTDMLSEAVAFGTVQVPNDGLPIVLMADRQSTGGYPRIAQVATADLPRLAQVMPGETIRFELVDTAGAQGLVLQRARHLEALRTALSKRRPA